MTESDKTYIPFIESNIENNPALANFIFNTDKNTIKKGDIVQCSFLKKLHKVVKIGSSDKILVHPIDNSNKQYTIKAKFLKLYKGKRLAIKVLYE